MGRRESKRKPPFNDEVDVNGKSTDVDDSNKGTMVDDSDGISLVVANVKPLSEAVIADSQGASKGENNVNSATQGKRKRPRVKKKGLKHIDQDVKQTVEPKKDMGGLIFLCNKATRAAVCPRSKAHSHLSHAQLCPGGNNSKRLGKWVKPGDADWEYACNKQKRKAAYLTQKLKKEKDKLAVMKDAEDRKEAKVEQMTLREYEKILSEKRKALESCKYEDRKVVFDSMQLVDKRVGDDVFLKLSANKAT